MAIDIIKFEAQQRRIEESKVINLSKREHFASMAMQGMLSNEETSNYYNTETLTEFAVGYADALIAELSKEDKQ